MTYRIDVSNREGRAFIERMFAHCVNPECHAVYGVAISGEKALFREIEQNEQWLSLVDEKLIAKSRCTRSNYGNWDGVYPEAGLLCLLDLADGFAFEGLFLELANELGDYSEEAVLRVTYKPAHNTFFADLVYHTPSMKPDVRPLKTWEGGE